MQQIRRWNKELLDSIKSYEAIQQVIRNPKFGVYGILFMAFTLWLSARVIRIVRRPQLDRSSTPDLEKPASRQAGLKAPERRPGGMSQACRLQWMGQTHYLQYGHQWISNGRQHHQHQTGLFIQQNLARTGLSGMAPTISLWVYEI